MREIAALKSAVSDIEGGKAHRHHANISLASTNLVRKVSSESIKSPTKWNEKTADISFDDKFSTIIDDGKASRDERSDKGRSLMTRQEINIASRLNYIESSDANESIEDVSVGMLPPQDDSFN